MKITLTTEQDIISYFNFIHSKGTLTTRLPSITLEGVEAYQYLQFLYETDPDDDDEPISEEPSVELDESTNTNSRWSQAEKDVLVSAIKNNTHPSDIAKALRRTENGVRHQARSTYKLVYQSGKWRDINYTN